MASSSSRKRGADDEQLAVTRPLKVGKDAPSTIRRLLTKGETKRGLEHALVTLSEAGLLNIGDTPKMLRRALTDASHDHSNAVTPYGRVVQSCDLGVPHLAKSLLGIGYSGDRM